MQCVARVVLGGYKFIALFMICNMRNSESYFKLLFVKASAEKVRMQNIMFSSFPDSLMTTLWWYKTLRTTWFFGGDGPTTLKRSTKTIYAQWPHAVCRQALCFKNMAWKYCNIHNAHGCAVFVFSFWHYFQFSCHHPRWKLWLRVPTHVGCFGMQPTGSARVMND